MNGRHKIRIWTMWLVELLVASFLSGCNHHDETCCQLAEMDSLIYTNPRRVLVQLDSSKPDGTMRKLINVEKLHTLGWTHTVEIEDGVQKLFNWYKNS